MPTVDRTSPEYHAYKSLKILFFCFLGAFLALFATSTVVRIFNPSISRALSLATIITAGILALSYTFYALAEIKLLAPLVPTPQTARSRKIGEWCGNAVFIGVALTGIALGVFPLLGLVGDQRVLAVPFIGLLAGIAIVGWAGLASAHSNIKAQYKKQEGAASS